METSFQELKKKEAVNILDGKRLGKVCDVVFTYPEGRVQGIVVPGGRGFHWGRGDLFIELRQIKKNRDRCDPCGVELCAAIGQKETQTRRLFPASLPAR